MTKAGSVQDGAVGIEKGASICFKRGFPLGRSDLRWRRGKIYYLPRGRSTSTMPVIDQNRNFTALHLGMAEHTHMPEPFVLMTQSGAVQTLALNRQAALNSLTAGLHAQLLVALEAAAGASNVRCVVITGMGRAFCAGQDLFDPSVAPDLTSGAPAKDLGRVINDLYRPLCLRIRSMPIPVLAAVNGVAAGAGAGANLALGCDLVLAARSASFIQVFSKIGLAPDTGGTWLLPRLVGRAQALGLALLGDRLPAPEAERLGLIWRCVDDASLQDEVSTLAQRLAALPVKALVAIRNAMDAAAQMDFGQALTQEAAMQQTLGFSADYREGIDALIGKRAPSFTDR